jgi:hypothetical protein
MTAEMPQQIVLLVYSLAIVIPFGQLLRRSALSRWWLLLAFVPVINVVALWVFAYVRWPTDRPRDDETEVSGHKANEVQALIDAIGHTGAVNAQRLRDQEP